SHRRFLLSIIPRPPPSTLFPYTTLFRSSALRRPAGRAHPAGGLLERDRPGRGTKGAALAVHRRGRGEAQARPAGPENADRPAPRSEEHTSELQSLTNLVCRLLLEKKKTN